MSLRQRIARMFAPGYSAEAVAALVREEVERVRMSLPIVSDYDPKSEGYRPASGRVSQRRDLIAISRDRMLEIAYFMWDHSAMIRRLALMDKAFLFAEHISVTTDNDKLRDVIERFETRNKLTLRFPKRIMWLGLLGEQCWPAAVNPMNGDVTLSYVDPQNVKEVFVLQGDVEQAAQVELQGSAGRSGKKMAVIREDLNVMSKNSFGRLVGECFFYAINNPPNDPRGRSDYLTLFDWVDGLERYEFNYLDRAENLLNFIWDVTLNGYTDEQCKEWARKNGQPPEPCSVRVHNEKASWDAVSPELKSTEHAAGYDTAKGFLLGAAGRPENWFGGGGKVYSQEADQINQPPMKDLNERLAFVGAIYEDMIRFQVDQAVIHKRLSEADAAEGFDVNLPEISQKDLTKVLNGVPQLSTALMLAENQGWITRGTAAGLFAFIISRLGYEVDAEDELKETDKDDRVTEDYKTNAGPKDQETKGPKDQ